MEDYYINKRRKRDDFWTGFVHNLVVGIVAGLVYFGFLIAVSPLEENQETYRIVGIIFATVLILGIAFYEYRVIRKRLKKRRYYAIGMIVALVLPMLAYGGCSSIMVDIGWDFAFMDKT